MTYQIFADGKASGYFYNPQDIITWANKEIERLKREKASKFKVLLDKVVRFKYSHDGKTDVKMVKVQEVILENDFIYLLGHDMMVFDEKKPTESWRKYRHDRIVDGDIKVF